MLKKLALATLVFAVLFGCAKKDQVKPNPDSILAKVSFEVAEGTRAAYAKRDFTALREFFTEEGFSFIDRGLGDFDKVDLKFAPRWVTIEGDKLTLNIAWYGIWTVGGQDVQGRGMAVFIMDTKTSKFEKVLRSNPFKVPQ